MTMATELAVDILKNYESPLARKREALQTLRENETYAGNPSLVGHILLAFSGTFDEAFSREVLQTLDVLVGRDGNLARCVWRTAENFADHERLGNYAQRLMATVQNAKLKISAVTLG